MLKDIKTLLEELEIESKKLEAHINSINDRICDISSDLQNLIHQNNNTNEY